MYDCIFSSMPAVQLSPWSSQFSPASRDDVCAGGLAVPLASAAASRYSCDTSSDATPANVIDRYGTAPDGP